MVKFETRARFIILSIYTKNTQKLKESPRWWFSWTPLQFAISNCKMPAQRALARFITHNALPTNIFTIPKKGTSWWWWNIVTIFTTKQSSRAMLWQSLKYENCKIWDTSKIYNPPLTFTFPQEDNPSEE